MLLPACKDLLCSEQLRHSWILLKCSLMPKVTAPSSRCLMRVPFWGNAQGGA